MRGDILIGATLLLALAGCAQTSQDANAVFSSFSADSCASQAIPDKFVVEWKDGHFSVEHGRDRETFTREFIAPQLDLIKHVEFDRMVTMAAPIQAKVDYSSEPLNWGPGITQASALWNQGFRGQGITVAVVDTYVDTTHPQLAGRIAVNAGEIPNNGIDDDGNGYVDDYQGMSFISGSNSGTVADHGTHVSGTIAADPAFGSVQGMAPQAKILPASFISNQNSGAIGDAVLALQFAAARGAKIINSSWGGTGCSQSLKNMFSSLSAQGILLVVAAGNDSSDLNSDPTYPALFGVPTQLTIAASNGYDDIAWFSNFGVLSQLAAPGEAIVSTFPGGGTGTLSGTSMATPSVSGAAALLWSAKPTATALQIKQAIIQGVDVPFAPLPVLTQGRLNVAKALTVLQTLVP